MKKLMLQNLNLDKGNRLSAEEKRKTMGGTKTPPVGMPYCPTGVYCYCPTEMVCLPNGYTCNQVACPAEP